MFTDRNVRYYCHHGWGILSDVKMGVCAYMHTCTYTRAIRWCTGQCSKDWDVLLNSTPWQTQYEVKAYRMEHWDTFCLSELPAICEYLEKSKYISTVQPWGKTCSMHFSYASNKGIPGNKSSRSGVTVCYLMLSSL